MTGAATATRRRHAQAQARAHLAEGDAAAARVVLRRLIDAGDTRVSVLHDLARALLLAGDNDAAVGLLRRLVVAAPHRADLALHLVAALQRRDGPEAALEECRAAVGRHPDDVPLWRALARLAGIGPPGEIALTAWRRVCELDPANPTAWRRLAAAARLRRDQETLTTAIDRWFGLAPEDPSARHLHAALHGESPERADPRYVAGLFDGYAESFDEHLAALGYRTPTVIAELVAASAGDAPVARAADLGCGTGQVGALLRRQTAHLDGVDLSSGMLVQAQARGCYDGLYRGDLVEFLRRRPGTYDLLVSADTLNYFGDLRLVVAAAAAALRDGGLFVASLEESAEPSPVGYRLEPSGRYSHAASWVRGVLRASGFEATFERTVLRREGINDVAGLLFVARRTEPGILPMSSDGPVGHAATTATTAPKEYQ